MRPPLPGPSGAVRLSRAAESCGRALYSMMKAPALLNCWDYFDRIYCISLLERPDRREKARREFSRVGLADKVEFLIVRRHPDDCEQGIYESHLTCIKNGIEAGAGRILIFEDDIVFDRFSSSGLKDSIDFLSQHPTWSALFFGCLVAGARKTRYKNILKIKYRSLTHAYVLSRKFAQVLVQRPWQKIAYDEFLQSFNHEFYAVYPAFAFQGDSSSDNPKYLWLDKIRRLCGGLKGIQKGNEFIFLHIRGILALHLLLALLGLFWII
jgi:GR25 family glycosyltransferase involved in LPS biosynthesis